MNERESVSALSVSWLSSVLEGPALVGARSDRTGTTPHEGTALDVYVHCAWGIFLGGRVTPDNRWIGSVRVTNGETLDPVLKCKKR